MIQASRLCLPSAIRQRMGSGALTFRTSSKIHSKDCRPLLLRRLHHTGISKKKSSTTPPLPYTRSYTDVSISTSDIQSSTVFRGTSFENRCLHLLGAHLGMVLRRVGGKEDGGVDLNGWWWLPDATKAIDSAVHIPGYSSADTDGDVLTKDPSSKRIRILAQCKAEKKKIGPKYVRELEGVVWRYMALEKDVVRYSTHGEVPKEHTPIVAVFLSESPFTKSAILRALSSQVPFLLMYVPPLTGSQSSHDSALDYRGKPDGPDSDSDFIAAPGSCIYNPALGGPGGLFKGEMEVRWCWSLPTSTRQSSQMEPSSYPISSSSSGTDSDAFQSLMHGAPVLFFRGKRLQGWVPLGLREMREEAGNTF